RKEQPDDVGAFGIGGRPGEQPSDRIRQIPSDSQHAEPMTVAELEGWILVFEALPEAPGPEILLPHVDVVAQHDPSLAELRAPRLEVVCPGLERVMSVAAEQVDAGSGKMVERFVECRSNQLRECREPTVVVSGPVLEDALVEQAGVGVAEPRVHGVARGGQPKMLHGLREARIAVARLAPEL